MKTVYDWITWFKDAPEDVKMDTLIHWSTKRNLYNKKQITLSRDEREELINFMCAINKLGYTSKAFLALINNKMRI